MENLSKRKDEIQLNFFFFIIIFFSLHFKYPIWTDSKLINLYSIDQKETNFFFLISKSRIVPTRWRWKNRRQLRKIKKEIQRDYRHKDFVCCCTEWIESEIFFLFFLVWFMLLVVCLFGATIGQSKQFSNLNLVKRMSQYLLCLACLC